MLIFQKLIQQQLQRSKKMSFSTSQIGAMAALVDVDKMTHEDAAKAWLAEQ
jgi:ABC-type proline/glycine betaine transport system substrate-binding protein